MSFQSLVDLIETNDADSLKQRLKTGASANASNAEGWTLAMFAAKSGSLECLKVLLSNDCDVNISANDDRTPLMIASFYGHMDCVEFLLQKGSKIDEVDENGKAAVMHAAQGEEPVILWFLINSGADIDLTDLNEVDLLTYAIKGLGQENPEDVGDDSGALACVRVLLHHQEQKGEDMSSFVNARNNINKTPLMVAAEANRGDIINFLIDLDANIDDQDNAGRTPLLWALDSESEEAVKVLLDAGASIDVADSKGETALFYALEANDETFDLILAESPNLNHQNKDGLTPLMKTVKSGDLGFTRRLIDSGADLNILDSYLDSALSYAICGFTEAPLEFPFQMVTYLLSSGVEYQIDLLMTKRSGGSKAVIDVLEKAALIDGDSSLSSAEKKLTKSIIFSSDLPAGKESQSCVEISKQKAVSFLRDQGVNHATKKFVLEKSAYLNPSIDPDVHAWGLDSMYNVEIAVNLAFFYGDRIDGLSELCVLSRDDVEEFVDAFLLRSQAARKCSVGEYFNGGFLDAVYAQAVDSGSSLSVLPSFIKSMVGSFLTAKGGINYLSAPMVQIVDDEQTDKESVTSSDTPRKRGVEELSEAEYIDAKKSKDADDASRDCSLSEYNFMGDLFLDDCEIDSALAFSPTDSEKALVEEILANDPTDQSTTEINNAVQILLSLGQVEFMEE